MEICLNKKNKVVKEWFDAVGERETYRQYILHNYALPNYRDYTKLEEEGSFPIEKAKMLLAEMLDVNTFEYGDIESLKNMPDETLGGFMANTFYFMDSINKREVNEEAFHAIFQTLTKPEERRNLFAIAEKLVEERLRKTKTTKKELQNRYNRVNNKNISWDYILEEELAKEFVNWNSYDNRASRELHIASQWRDKDLGFVQRLINSLKNFFNRLLGLQKVYQKYPEVLQEYFTNIKQGKYKNTIQLPIEDQILRDYPSLSTLSIFSNRLDTNVVLSPSEQSIHYGKMLNIVRTLSNSGVLTEDGNKFTKEALIKDAVNIYRDEVLESRDENSTDYEFYDSLLEEFDEESQNFKAVVKDLRQKLNQIEAAVSELGNLEEDTLDDLGWNFTEFIDKASNERNPQDSLSSEIKVMLSTTLIDTGDAEIKVSRNKFVDGKIVKQEITIPSKRLIEPYKVYNALISVTSNTSSPSEKIKKLIIYTNENDSNEETKAFLDGFLLDVYRTSSNSSLNKTDLIALKEAIIKNPTAPKDFILSNTNKFKKITKGFDLWTMDVDIMNVRPTKKEIQGEEKFKDNGLSSTFEPLFTVARNTQIGNWEQNFQGKSLESKLEDYKALKPRLRNSFLYLPILKKGEKSSMDVQLQSYIKKRFSELQQELKDNPNDITVEENVSKKIENLKVFRDTLISSSFLTPTQISNFQGLYNDFVSYLTDSIDVDLKKTTDLFGINISASFRKWIVAEELSKGFYNYGFQISIPQEYKLVYDNFLMSSYEFNLDLASMATYIEGTFKDLEETGVIPIDQDPYSKDVSSDDRAVFNFKNELETLAHGNVYFDESVLPPTFRNPDGKDIYRYQQQTQFLKFSNEIIRDEKRYDDYLSKIESQEKSNRTYLRDNLFTKFIKNLSNKERSRLQATSLGGIYNREADDFSSDDEGVANDLEAINFVQYQLNLMLNKMYVIRESIKDENGIITDPSIITVPFFKGVNEVSKTKSFLSGQWFKEVMKPVSSLNEDGSIDYSEQLVSLLDNNTAQIGIGDGSVVLAKNLIQQDVTRIAEELELYLRIINDTKGNTKGEANQKSAIKIDTNLLRKTYGLDKVALAYHTGELPIAYNSTKEIWEIDYDALSNNSAKNIPRSLIIMKDSNGYINNSARALLYKRISEGNINLNDFDLNPENKKESELLDTEIKKAITNHVSTSIDSILERDGTAILDVRYSKLSNDVNKNKSAGILGFKYEFKGTNPLAKEATIVTKQTKNNILKHNLALSVLNDMFNRQSLQRVLHGNIALLNKNDNLEYAKRNKHENATISSAYTEFSDSSKGVDAFTNLSYIVETAAANKSVKPTSGATEGEIDSDDAQGLSSVWARKKLLHGLDTLSQDMALLIDKIHNGEILTLEEEARILKSKNYLNAEKTLGADPMVTLKMSETMLTKQLTAHKTNVTQRELLNRGSLNYRDFVTLNNIVTDSDGEYVSYMMYPIVGATSEYTVEPILTDKYPTKKEALENGSFNVFQWVPVSLETDNKRKILDGWRPTGDNTWEYRGTDQRIDLHVVTTASKRMTQNVWDGTLTDFDSDFHTSNLSTEYYGRQVANPSKKEIKDPTQQLEILTSLLPDKFFITDDSGNRLEVTKDQAISAYHNTLSDRDLNALNLFEDLVIDQSSGQVKTDIMFRIIQETLAESGGDKQLLDFFNIDPNSNRVFNPNIAPIATKFKQQLLALTSNNVLSHKVKGDAYAMVTPKGHKLLKKLLVHTVDGQEIYTWEVIPKNSPDYGTHLLKAQNNKIADGLTYNGYDLNNPDRKGRNTLVDELKRLREQSLGENVYFLDELRFNKPKIVTDKDGNSIIQDYYSETLIPVRDVKDYTDLFKTNRYVQGVRIPSQSKATSVNIEVVDFLPTFYGNTVMITKEAQELAGSDFDIDKIFIQFYDGYYENIAGQDVFKKYDKSFEDYQKYIFKNNKIVKKELRTLLDSDQEYQNAFTELRELETIKSRLELRVNSITDSKVRNRLINLFTDLDNIYKDIDTLEEYERDTTELEEFLEIWNKKAQATLNSVINSEDFTAYWDDFTTFGEIINRKILLRNRIENIEKLNKEKIFKTLFRGLTKEDFEREYTAEEIKAGKKPRYRNQAVINNELLDLKKKYLTANMDAYTIPVTVDNLKPILTGELDKDGNVKAKTDIHNTGVKLKGEIDAPFSSMLFDLNYLEGASVGVGGIGSTVMANLAWLALARNGTLLNKEAAFKILGIPEIGDVSIDKFELEVKTLNDETFKSVSDRISEIISAATDEAKEGIISRLKLKEDLLSVYMAGLSVGIDPQIMVAVLNTPIIQNTIKKVVRQDFGNKKFTSFRELLNIEISELQKKIKASDKSLNETRSLFGEFDFNSLLGLNTNDTGLTENKASTFKPVNQEQENAISSINEFIKNSDQEYYILEGKAGTGKTSIAQEFIRQAIEDGHTVVVGAMTHKAKDVIEQKVRNSVKSNKVSFNTIDSLVGRKMNEYGEFVVDFNADQSLLPISKGTLIVIDEASMVNEEALQLINSFKNKDAKVVFLGDRGQPAPIRREETDAISPVFEIEQKSSLLERVRQGEESPILPYADYYWNNSESDSPDKDPIKSFDNSITEKGSLVGVSSFNNIKETVINLFDKAIKAKDNNYVKIITYKNATRKSYNDSIRKSIFGNSVQEFVPGDFIMMYDTYYAIASNGEYLPIKNSEEFIISKADKYVNESGWNVWDLTYNKTPEYSVTVQVIAQEDSERYKKHVENLFDIAKKYPKKTPESKAAFNKAFAAKEAFANLDYGYAITSHKSQGSTYKVAVIDKTDIMAVTKSSDKDKSRSIYTALTRPSNTAIIIDGNPTVTKDLTQAISLVPEPVKKREIRTSARVNGFTPNNETQQLIFVDKLFTIAEQNKDFLKLVRLKKGTPKDITDFLTFEETVNKLGYDMQGKKLEVSPDDMHSAYDFDLDKPGMEQYKNYITNVIPRLTNMFGKVVLELNPNYTSILEDVKDVAKFDTTTNKRDTYKALNRAILGTVLNNQEKLLGSQSEGEMKHTLDVNLLTGFESIGKQLEELKNEPRLKEILENNLIFRKIISNFGSKRQINKVLREATFKTGDDLKKLEDRTVYVDIDTLSLNLFSKMNPEVQESFLDAFTELLHFNKSDSLDLNSKVQSFAKGLFYYNTIKDGQEYSPLGVGKILPTSMFNTTSDLYDSFMTTILENDLKKEVVERFVRDTKNVKLLKEEDSSYVHRVSSNNGSLVYTQTSLNESPAPYFTTIDGKKIKLFKYISKESFKEEQEDKSIRNVQKNYYVEIPTLGTRSYNSSIANSNVVSNKRDAVEILGRLKDIENLPSVTKPIKNIVIEIVNEISSNFSIDITTKDGKQLTGKEIISDSSNFQVVLTPLSEIGFRKTRKIDLSDDMSPFKHHRAKIKIGDQSFFSPEHYMIWSKAITFGDRALATRIFDAKGFSYERNPTTEDPEKLAEWDNKSHSLYERALREYYNTPERRAILQEWKDNDVTLNSDDLAVRSIIPLIYKIMEDMDGSSFNRVEDITKSESPLNLTLPNLPTYVLNRENLKAEYADYYMAFSSKKKGLAASVVESLDKEKVNPNAPKVKGKKVMLGFNDKSLLTDSDLDLYKRTVKAYLEHGGTIITNSTHDLKTSSQDYLLTEDKSVNGLNSGMRLIDYYLRNELKLVPSLKLLMNDDSMSFVNTWSIDSIIENLDSNIKSTEVKTLSKVPQAEKIKAPFKSKNSIGFIGFGKPSSSTEYYAQQYKAQGLPVNPDNYEVGKVYFASQNGDGTNREQTLNQIEKALNSGSFVLLDSKKYIDSSNYNNQGEGWLYNQLINKGYKNQKVSNEDTTMWYKDINNERSQVPQQNIEITIGQYVKYKEEIYIVTKFNNNNTIQIYNPLLEGAKAKISVKESNLEPVKGTAQIVIYNNNEYLVTAKDTIIFLTTNKKMNWEENNKDRQAILAISKLPNKTC